MSATSQSNGGTFTHVVRDSDTGVVLDYCTSQKQAEQFAAEENEIAFNGEARAIVEPLQ